MPSEMVSPKMMPLPDLGWRDEPPQAAAEADIPRDVYRAVGRHRLLFAGSLLAVSLGGVVLARALPARYSASSTVLIETSQPEAVTLNEMLTDTRADAEAIATELELLDSREFIERVADRLRLVDDPAFNASLRPDPVEATLRTVFGPGVAASWSHARPAAGSARPMNGVVDAFRRRLAVAPAGRARAIRITFTSGDPRMAATVVNAMADLYMAEHGRLREEETRQANAWIDQRLLLLRDKADRSAAAVARYRTEHGLLRGRDSLLADQEIGEASSQLMAARARQTDAAVALADAHTGSPHLATVLDSPVIQQLRAEEARLTAQQAELSSRLGDAHPARVAIDAQIRDVRSQIGAETGRLVRSLRSASDMAAASGAATAARMAEARQRAEAADTLDPGLRALEREAAVDSNFYQTFLTRSRETDPSFSFPRTNVRVLSRAVPPDQPSSPGRRLVVLAGLVLGLLAASAAVALRELLTPGLRKRESFERLLGQAPVGTIPFLRRLREPQRQEALQDAAASLLARLADPRDGTLPRSVLVTSAVPREGKTICSRLLAAAAAEQGQRVLMIDADLYRSSLTTAVCRRSDRPGLADILRGETGMGEAVIQHLPNLDIIPAGHVDRSSSRLLTSARLGSLLAFAEAEYDLVIVDSPPILVSPDGWLLARGVQSTLLLVRWGHTTAEAVQAAIRQLSEGRARNLQLVMSQVDVARHARYGDAAARALSQHGRSYRRQLGIAAR